jgi:hypothetical protein
MTEKQHEMSCPQEKTITDMSKVVARQTGQWVVLLVVLIFFLGGVGSGLFYMHKAWTASQQTWSVSQTAILQSQMRIEIAFIEHLTSATYEIGRISDNEVGLNEHEQRIHYLEETTKGFERRITSIEAGP